MFLLYAQFILPLCVSLSSYYDSDGNITERILLELVVTKFLIDFIGKTLVNKTIKVLNYDDQIII